LQENILVARTFYHNLRGMFGKDPDVENSFNLINKFNRLCPADGASTNGGDMLQSASLGRKVKVVRLRSQVSTEDTGATEF
jgi:hypothetical protein